MRLTVALLSLISFIAPQVAAQQAYAHAVLHPFYNSTNANTATPVQGTVDFVQNDNGQGNVTVTVKVLGLQANKSYSIHVHQWGNLDGYVNLTNGVVVQSNLSLPAVGGHFNPFNVPHGCGYGNTRHVGDIGNVTFGDVNSTTWVTQVLTSELLDLGRDQIWNNSIIGRTVAIHEWADPCTPDATSLGGWVAIGVIGINNVAGNNATSEPLTPDGIQAPQATAIIFNTTSGKPSGEINFWTDPVTNATHMQGFLTGFAPFSEHGIHIHQFGNEDDSNSIGLHFGPATTVHALPPKQNRHWGDLGNVVADADGDIIFSDVTASLNLISIQTPLNSILGRAIAIHEFGDNGTSTSYGPRNNFGVIGLAAPDFVRPTPFIPRYPSVARAQVIFRPFYNSSIALWPDTLPIGNVTFTQNVDGTGVVNITVVVSGLRGNASYGLHVHEYGNEIASFNWTTGAPLTNTSGLGLATSPSGGVGGHLNPFNVPHGCAPNTRHTGDIGNITVPALSDDQRSTFFTYNLTSELLDLGRDGINNNSIIGRTVTLHDKPNPCDPTVALGNWIAIGVIGIDTTNITGGEQNVAAQDDGLPWSNDNNSPKANAVIRDVRNGQIVGDLFFWRGYNNEIRVIGAVAGFVPNSTHGVHIHQFGNENTNTSIGPHWAAPGQDGNDFHALAPYAGRHYGDVIGNITADANGLIIFNNISTGFDLLSLTSAANSIIGHSIAFHERADDGTAASYGPRYRFGVIGLVHPDFPIPTAFTAPAIPPATVPTTPTSSAGSSGGFTNSSSGGVTNSTGGSTNSSTAGSTGSSGNSTSGSGSGSGSGSSSGSVSGSGSPSGTGGNATTRVPTTAAPTTAAPPSAATILTSSLALVITLIAIII